jgi:hypothetical protein
MKSESTCQKPNGVWSRAKGSLPAMSTLFVLAGVIAYLWWLSCPHDFRGKLVYEPDRVVIPEDPPPLAHLVTADGAYALDIPRYLRRDRVFVRQLADLNGRDVVVHGTRSILTSRWRRCRVICVDDLRLSTPSHPN